MHSPGVGVGSHALNDPSARPAPTLPKAASADPASAVLELPQLQHRPAEPEPPLHREAQLVAARTRRRATG
jgi:hypothetical protein